MYLEGIRKGTPYVVSSPKKVGIFRFTVGKTKYDDRYGHAWLTDGYEKVTGYYYNPNHNNYFYATIANHLNMNWGWGGYLNGWYDYDTWERVAPYVHNNSVDYIYDQKMINNITPN